MVFIIIALVQSGHNLPTQGGELVKHGHDLHKEKIEFVGNEFIKRSHDLQK